MRFSATIFLFSIILLPNWAHAGCSPTLQGQSEVREITISDCSHAEMVILITDFSPTVQGGVPRKPLPLARHCVFTRSGLTCKRGGGSPLAGSTYRYTSDTNPTCEGERAGQRLTCVRGCSKQIPKYFYIEPWEC